MLQISSLLLFLLLQPISPFSDSLFLVPISNEQTCAFVDHKSWDQLLNRFVEESGNVNYDGFKKESETLNRYLEQLGSNTVNENWSKNKKLAYYINLYNAATVKLILDNYPLKSITDIKKPWGKKWIKYGGELISLGQIEHKILRKMNEPRIHFAINCASFSCPKLLNEAYTEDKLEKQLHKATKDFINDPSRNIISENKVELSEIFKWYKKDFENNGSLIAYLNQYLISPINPDAKIEYIKYNWSLNEIK
ncbi:MAG: DUF547 domain-containing protein [Eudoraea sp.]|nr:DUF547 domain-containing protein [Eudoraea sp.]